MNLPDPINPGILVAQDQPWRIDGHFYRFLHAIWAYLKDQDDTGGSVGGTVPYQLYTGFNAGSYVGGDMLYFNPGTIANADGTALFTTDKVLMVDVSTIGVSTWSPPDSSYSTLLGGMAEGAVADPSPLSFYAITRDSDDALSVLASSYTTYGDVSPYVPVGWTLCRKLHFEVVYNTSRGTNWSGIPDFFQDIVGTKTILSGAGADSNYQLLSAGSATSFTSQSAAAFVADACRTITVFVHATASGSAGTCYLRTPGTVTGFPVAEVQPGENVYGEFTLKLAGDRTYEYMVTGGATLSLYIKDYTFDEPT